MNKCCVMCKNSFMIFGVKTIGLAETFENWTRKNYGSVFNLTQNHGFYESIFINPQPNAAILVKINQGYARGLLRGLFPFQNRGSSMLLTRINGP